MLFKEALLLTARDYRRQLMHITHQHHGLAPKWLAGSIGIQAQCVIDRIQ